MAAIPGVTYFRRYPEPDWKAPGRPDLDGGGFAPPPAEIAGAKPIGTADYSIPTDRPVIYLSTTGNDASPGSVTAPKRTLRACIDTIQNGGAIVIRGGEYRERVGSCTKSITVQNYPGEAVWFDGTDVVTFWSTPGDGTWRTPWSIEFDNSASYSQGSNAGNFVNAAYPFAAYPDAVFIDGQRQRQVAVGQTPAPGEFSIDYASNNLRIGSNPTGKTVRVGARDIWLIAQARMTIRGIGIRRYSNSLWMMGMLSIMRAGGGTLVENCHFVDAATQHMSANGADTVIRNNTFFRAGMTSIHSNESTRLALLNNHISESNWERFNAEPAAAGIKITRVLDCNIANNYVETSLGCAGIWLDVSCYGGKITGNYCLNNGKVGIEVELSGYIIVAGNWMIGAPTCLYGFYGYNADKVKLYNNYVDSATQWQIGFRQDGRRSQSNPSQPNYSAFWTNDPATSLYWVNREEVITNNVFGGVHNLFQFYCLDMATGIPADNQIQRVDGNLFSSGAGQTPPALDSNRMVGWGTASNTTTNYRTPAAFQAAKSSYATRNAMTELQAPDRAAWEAVASSVALPIPADVAAAMGVPADLVYLGPPRPQPVLAS